VPAKVTYSQLAELLATELDKAKPQNSACSLSLVDIYAPKADDKTKHMTFHVEVAAYDRTLKTDEVNQLLDKVAAAAKKSLAAQRV
jgi:phenylalanyl-tRNA synthetase beta subunit